LCEGRPAGQKRGRSCDRRARGTDRQSAWVAKGRTAKRRPAGPGLQIPESPNRSDRRPRPPHEARQKLRLE
jgi:hypothetical protein